MRRFYHCCPTEQMRRMLSGKSEAWQIPQTASAESTSLQKSLPPSALSAEMPAHAMLSSWPGMPMSVTGESFTLKVAIADGRVTESWIAGRASEDVRRILEEVDRFDVLEAAEWGELSTARMPSMATSFRWWPLATGRMTEAIRDRLIRRGADAGGGGGDVRHHVAARMHGRGVGTHSCYNWPTAGSTHVRSDAKPMRTKGLPSLPSAYSPRTPGQAGPAPRLGRVAPMPPAFQSGRAPAAVQFKPATPGARLPPPPAIFAVAQAKTAPVPVRAVSAPPPFRPGRPPGAAPLKPHAPAALAIQRFGGGGAWGQGPPRDPPKTAVLTGADFPGLVPMKEEGKAPPMAPIIIALPERKVGRRAPARRTDPLAALKKAIGTTWDRRTHVGKELALTEKQILNVSNWAVSVHSRTGATMAFNVMRGAGSGSYAAVDQLKIISIHGELIGDKRPTYHITLR